MLEGTVGANGKSITAVGATQLKILRAAREEVKIQTYCVPTPHTMRIKFEPAFSLALLLHTSRETM